MPDNLSYLEEILHQELEIFTKILVLEQDKTEAIINKNGNLIQQLSLEQEQCLNSINPLEQNRKKITEKYLTANPGENITLKHIASIEGNPKSPLVKTGEELKRTLEKIKIRQSTNTKMINDNMEYITKMVNVMKESAAMETGYSNIGKKNDKNINPLILDKKI